MVILSMENVPKNKTPTNYQKTFADSIHSECGKIQTKKNSVFGHFSCSVCDAKKNANKLRINAHCVQKNLSLNFILKNI